MKYLIYRLSFSLLILSVPVADAITWTNTAGGDWNTPQNWSPNQVPGGNDTATISSSGFKVRISGTNSTLGLTLSANSSLTVLSNGVFNILGDTIIRGSFTNQGTVVWQAGVVDLYNSGTSPNLGVIWNSAGALWDTQCDQSFSALSPSLEQFHNFGVFRKSVTTGTTTVGIHFDNQGTVDGQTGMVNFPIGGNLSGTFSGQVGVKSATAVITGAFSGTFNLYTNGGFT